jgi:LysR family transcriptional regulator, transcriptional activator for bauABCD operon
MRHNPRRFTLKLSDGDLRRLHVFCTVTRCGGFAAAESELQMGLPSISRFIKDLEIRLGFRLCQRGRVGFALTDQGRLIYAASLQLTSDLKRFEAKVTSIHSALAGTLNIGIIDTLITDRNLPLPKILKEYKRKHSHVEFNLQTKCSNVIEQSVIEGTLDAGLVIGAGAVVGRRQIDQLDYRLLYKELNSLYCSEEHPLYYKDQTAIAIDDVSRYDYAGYSFLEESDRSGPTRMLLKTASVDSVEAMATLISSGCYIAMLPEHYVDSVWRLKHFRSILPEVFSVSNNIELITRKGSASPLMLALLDVIDNLEGLAQPAAAVNGTVTPLNRIDRDRTRDRRDKLA